MPPKTPLLIATAACLLLLAPSSFGRVLGVPQGPALATLVLAADRPASFFRQWIDAPVWHAQADIGVVNAPVDMDPARVIEAQVRQLLADVQRQQLQLALLKQRLTAAESASAWMPLLTLGGLALVALAGWLALRVHRLKGLLRVQTRRVKVLADAQAQAQADVGAASASQALTSVGTPLFAPQPSKPVAMLASLAATASATRVAAALSPRADTDSIGADLRQHSSLSLGTGVPPRPVSVEELLDLDQQVDFFIVLGQAQSAVDLLLSHVRATGGANALPYCRLLQIYRQLGDEEAYERTRDRFNQRFNAQAPDWQGDLAAGRCLEQYPEVVARLQRAWPQPLRAVAELESLLLRRADLEPFDLPAFHDILTLHALVRDLPALPVAPSVAAPAPESANPAEPNRVDLWLPLGDEPQDITAPRPRMAEPGTVARAMLADWVFSRAGTPLANAGSEALDPNPADRTRSLTRLDLDLTDYGPAPREFTRPAAFTDIDMRRDSRRSDLAAFDDSDLLPPETTRR